MSLWIYLEDEHGETVYDGNITHNLKGMANAVGLFGPLWVPAKQGITIARDLVGPLEFGIAEMERDPASLAIREAPNGWGTYQEFHDWLECLLAACRQYPEATIRVTV